MKNNNIYSAQKQLLSSSTKSNIVWDFDAIVCSAFFLIAPHFIFDAFSRNFVQSNLFQVNWIFIIIGNLRILTIFLSKGNHQQNQQLQYALKIFSPIFWLILYTLLLTFNQANYLIDNNIYFGSISIDFIVKRGIKYCALAGFALYFSTVVNSWKKFYSVLVFLIYGLCIAEILGLVQSIVFVITKIDILPIQRTGIGGLLRSQSVTVNFLGTSWLRINALSHEPKGFAGLMYILFIFKLYNRGFFMHATQYIVINNSVINYMKKTLPLTIIVILLTFSGSGIFMMATLLIFVGFTTSLNLLVSGKFSPQLVLVFVLATLLLLGFIYYPSYFDSFLDVSFYRRMSSFIQNRDIDSLYLQSLDPEDGAFINSLFNHSDSVLTGIGFGGAANLSLPFVTSRYGQLITSGVSTFSRNILIEVLFSSGIIGVVFCLFFAKNLFRYYSIYPSTYTPIILAILSSFFLRSNETIFFSFVGLCGSLSYIIYNENSFLNKVI